jgi:hypothetical protein
MTPTSPLPADVRSFRVAIAVKEASNDEMLSPAGMVAVTVGVGVVPPQAAAITATMPALPITDKRLSLRNFM